MNSNYQNTSRDSAKETAKKAAVGSGIAVGTVAGGTLIAAGAANITAAAAATAASQAAVGFAVANTAGTIFAPFAAGLAATVTNPATWAVLATNPVGQVLLIGGGVTIGAVAAYKVAARFLGE